MPVNLCESFLSDWVPVAHTRVAREIYMPKERLQGDTYISELGRATLGFRLTQVPLYLKSLKGTSDELWTTQGVGNKDW